MAVSMSQIKTALEPEEPDYAAATALGADAIPHLQAIVQGDDAMLASKAAYLAGLISDQGSRQVVETAARHADPVVRVAAAAAAGRLSTDGASDLLANLVTDSDPGVRKVARSSVPEEPSEVLEQRLAEAPGETSEDEGNTGIPRPAVINQLMPGERSGRFTMPGESSGLMPGESRRGDPTAEGRRMNRAVMPGESSGLMPGESQGRMPGEMG